MPEFTAWLTRCEEFLEAGLPAQDVLWYLGDAVDHKPDEEYPFPEGFRADYLNHDVLTNRLAVKDGLFVVPEGTTWKVLWVPDERFMLPATRKRLGELAAAGGMVVFGGKANVNANVFRSLGNSPGTFNERHKAWIGKQSHSPAAGRGATCARSTRMDSTQRMSKNAS